MVCMLLWFHLIFQYVPYGTRTIAPGKEKTHTTQIKQFDHENFQWIERIILYRISIVRRMNGMGGGMVVITLEKSVKVDLFIADRLLNELHATNTHLTIGINLHQNFTWIVNAINRGFSICMEAMR